jgi:sigma-B regulation protein RsbU (phosphoserine phosphatase)
MRANASNTVSLLVNENINRIEGKLSRIQLLARNIRYSVQAGLITGEQFQLMVAAALRENPDISSLCLAYEPSIQNLPRAQVYFVRNTDLVVNILNPEEYPYEDWYQIPIMSGEQRWSEPWYDRAGSQTLISSYSIPIISNGRYIGILRLDTQLSKLQQMISTDSRQQIGKMLLLTNNGTFVSSQIDSLVMNYGIFSLAEEYNDEELRKIGQDMIYGRSGVQKLGGKHMFEDYWITYAPLKSNGWSLAVLMSERTIFRDLNLLTLIQGIASAIAFLLLAVILLLRIRHINKPLSALTAAVERVGSGDFDTVIPHSSDFYELQMLTNSFEAMRDSLSDYIENLRKTTEEKNA